MPDVSKHCSVRERVAEEAERETDKLKKVEFMKNKIGNVYEGNYFRGYQLGYIC